MMDMNDNESIFRARARVRTMSRAASPAAWVTAALAAATVMACSHTAPVETALRPWNTDDGSAAHARAASFAGNASTATARAQPAAAKADDPAAEPTTDSSTYYDHDAWAAYFAPLPDDSVLTRKVREALDKDPLTANAPIEVDVTATVATLTGNVPSLAASDAAEEIAAKIDGVSKVDNSLELGPPPELFTHPRRSAYPSDEDLRATLDSELGVSPLAIEPKLQIDVTGGVVTLSGTVSTRLAQRTAIVEAYHAGARRVIDHMRLVPLEVSPDGD